MKTNTLSFDIETLVELTPEDAKQVNGGLLVSSAAPSQFQPTPTAVSSAKPPAPVHHKHKKHHHPHQTVSSVMPTPPVPI